MSPFTFNPTPVENEIPGKEYGLLKFVNFKDEPGNASNDSTSTNVKIAPTHNRKAIHWLFFIQSDHFNFDLTVDFENCAMWNFAKFSILNSFFFTLDAVAGVLLKTFES